MKYVKKPIPVEATQWFKNGDHPEDDCHYIDDKSPDRYLSEGKVVRRYNIPNDKDERGKDTHCFQCKHMMSEHGWIETLEGGHIVCPSDWIITGIKGEKYPCKASIFAESYEAFIPTESFLDSLAKSIWEFEQEKHGLVGEWDKLHFTVKDPYHRAAHKIIDRLRLRRA